MKLVTAHTGTAHITANDDGDFNKGIFGNGLVILANGNKLRATITNNNTINIGSGSFVFQGRHGLIESGTSENVTIDSGTSGRYRIDLICLAYEKTNEVESIELVVKKGTSTTSSTPTEPSYTAGDISSGATYAELPLYSVYINGLSIESVTRKTQVLPYLFETAGKKINYGTSLPSASNYSDGDIFLLYS